MRRTRLGWLGITLAGAVLTGTLSPAHAGGHPSNPDGPQCIKIRKGDTTDWGAFGLKARISHRGVKCWTSDGSSRGYVRGKATRVSFGIFPPRACAGGNLPHASEGWLHHLIFQNAVVIGHRKGRSPDAEILRTSVTPLCRQAWHGDYHGGYWWWGRTFQWGGDLGMTRRQRRVSWDGPTGVTWWSYVRPVCADTTAGDSMCGDDGALAARRLRGRL